MLYYANLNPVIGSEQWGTRPVTIISNNIRNKYSVDYLDQDSIVLLEQIRTIDKQRLQEYLGHLDERLLNFVDQALAISVSLNR